MQKENKRKFINYQLLSYKSKFLVFIEKKNRNRNVIVVIYIYVFYK